MAKELRQILFDFSTEEEKPKNAPPPQQVAPVAKKSTRGRKKLKETGPEIPIDVPEDELLFQKAYYGIGEVAEMFHEKVSLIRFWENQFDILEPRKNRKGDRFFKPEDIKNLQLIHDLIRRRKFTLEGAREHIKKTKQVKDRQSLIESLQKIKSFLLELKANL